MEIRAATIDDAAAVLALQHLAYQSEAAIYDDFTLPPLLETVEEIQARFGLGAGVPPAETERRFLKAVDNDRIVGSVRAFQDGTTLHVERLVVHPDCRRRGIGTALLNQIETIFPTARRFELFTGHKSQSNIRLYERLGYRIFREENVNEKVSLVFMEKATCIRDFRPSDKQVFRRLNEEWITRYFAIEEKDRKLFDDPEGEILAKGGMILILATDGQPVGCCALLELDAETFEVAKMAVTEAHQGKGLGRLLLNSCIDRAKFRGKKRLFLETNSRLDAAISLYRRLGFVELPRSVWPSSEYARVDVVMQLLL